MYIVYNDIDLYCRKCGAHRRDCGYAMSFGIDWVNQHGSGIRLHCPKCTYKSKVTKLTGKPERVRMFNEFHRQVDWVEIAPPAKKGGAK